MKSVTISEKYEGSINNEENGETKKRNVKPVMKYENMAEKSSYATM
jgi:hypothetical protein